MKISDLRALAAYHREQSQNLLVAAHLMNAPASADMVAQAEQHKDWADKITELANAFEMFGHVLTEK